MKRTLSFERARDGFTLAEIMVAIGLCVLTFTCFSAATGQAMRMAQRGKQENSASQVLQHRFETFHAIKQWSNLLAPAALRPLIATTPAASAGLHAPSESYTISAYPAGTPQFTITRSATGTVTTAGSALPATVSSVKIVAKLQWTGVGKTSRSREQATVFTKGGI